MDSFMFSASPPEPDPPRDTDGLSLLLFKQVVSIAKGYHLDAAEPAA